MQKISSSCVMQYVHVLYTPKYFRKPSPPLLSRHWMINEMPRTLLLGWHVSLSPAQPPVEPRLSSSQSILCCLANQPETPRRGQPVACVQLLNPSAASPPATPSAADTAPPATHTTTNHHFHRAKASTTPELCTHPYHKLLSGTRRRSRRLIDETLE